MSGPPTKGERNANPGNLRYNRTIHWQGLADPPQDATGFCIFTTAYYGLRALSRDLYIANTVDGLDTVMALVDKFAPQSENNTAAYIEDVADRLGVDADAKIDLSDAQKLQVFAHAVVLHENGRCIYPDSLLEQAAQAAVAGK